MEKLTVILPTKNEIIALPYVLNELTGFLPDFKCIVSDGLSQDGTPEKAKELGLDVVSIKSSGVGEAFKGALEHIATPYTLLIDCDYTYEIDELTTIALKDMEISNIDLVIGCRRYMDWKAMSPTHRLGNYALSALASILWRPIDDVCTGFWLFRTDSLKSLNIESKAFTLVEELYIKSVKKKFKIKHLHIGYRPRLDGSSSKLRYSDGLKLAWFLIKEKFHD